MKNEISLKDYIIDYSKGLMIKDEYEYMGSYHELIETAVEEKDISVLGMIRRTTMSGELHDLIDKYIKSIE